jgi:hypothetical protein
MRGIQGYKPGEMRPPDVTKAIVERVAQAIERAGKTRAQVRKATDIPPSTFYSRLRTDTQFSVDELERIAANLGVGVADFIPAAAPCPAWCVSDAPCYDDTAIRHSSKAVRWVSSDVRPGARDAVSFAVWLEKWRDDPTTISIDVPDCGDDMSPADARRLAAELVKAAERIEATS